MSEIKWIKLTTGMFDDEKIKLIESMPDADSILVIWIKSLVQAGRTNANGYIYLTEHVPYTDEMLATVFNRPLNTVRLALDTFAKFNMIEMCDEGLYVQNWEKHQNVEGMERIKEQNRLRAQRFREKKKKEKNEKSVTLQETLPNGPEVEVEVELEVEVEKEEEKRVEKNQNGARCPYKEIVELYNEICISLPKVRELTETRKRTMRRRWLKHKDVNVFKEAFTVAQDSHFLTVKWHGCNFDWLIKEANMVKVLEGTYNDSKEGDNGKAKGCDGKDLAGKYRKFVSTEER